MADRVLITERRVQCTDRKSREQVVVTFRIFRRSGVTSTKRLRLVELILENDFAGGGIELPGIDEMHALALCLLHIESFLLDMTILHDVVFENGVPFDRERYSVFFGEDQRSFQAQHIDAASTIIQSVTSDEAVQSEKLAVNTTTLASAKDSAEKVLVRMAEAYASLHSYADTGVLSIYDDVSDTVTFETAFVRPNCFRFAWASHHPPPPLRHIKWSSVIWSDEKGVFSWHDYGDSPNTVKKEGGLEVAVASAYGVSGGSALTIAALLHPEIIEISFCELDNPRLIGMENVDDVPCYHVVGTQREMGERDFWIGEDDFMLRKSRISIAGTVIEEIRRNISINETIPFDTFSPPK